MHHLPLEERPRERCLKEGPECLSLRECLAILIGTGPQGKGCLGLAQDVLEKNGQFHDSAAEEVFFRSLEQTPLSALKGIRGIGPASEARILAAFELAKRYRKEKTQPLPSSTQTLQSKILSQIPRDLRFASKEWLGMVPLQDERSVGRFHLIEKGVRTHVNLEIRSLFLPLLSLHCAGFALFHNHPSGRLTPSEADFHLTEEVDRLAQAFGIELIGHWIVFEDQHRQVEV